MRMRDEQMQHDDDMEMIQEDLRDKEAQLQAISTQFEHEMSLSEQKIMSLNDHLKETKQALDDIQEKHSKSLDQQMESFNKERKQMLDKADEVSQLITEKEKRITALENQNESLNYQSSKREDELDMLRSEYNQQKRVTEDQIEKMREEAQKISDEAMKNKLEQGREEALLRQQTEYLEKKNQELVKALTDSSMSYQEKLDFQKAELGNEINQKIEQITAEKERISVKFDEKRKALKDLEKSSSVTITKLEREKAVSDEKLQNLEKKLASEVENSKATIEGLKEQIGGLKSEGSKTLIDVENKYNDLKQEYADLQKERAEINSKYEREKALLENQVNFIKEQNDRLKAELTEKQDKLETTIMQLQNKSSNRDSDKKQMEMINQIENDYKKQIISMQESHERINKEMSDKNKDIEAKYHSLQEKYELSVRESNSVNKALEKRVNDFELRDKQNQEEILRLKTDRDRMLVDSQSSVDQEINKLKTRNDDLEKKCKDYERVTTSHKFEIEKEKARWSSEKDYLESSKNDLMETVAKLEKKNESLVAQNEKLKERAKNKSRMTTKYGGNTSILESGIGSRFTAGKFLGVKELDQDNYSNNSSHKGSRFGTFTKFISDGKEIGDKKSTTSNDDVKILNDTPERYGGKSESTNTLSPEENRD